MAYGLPVRRRRRPPRRREWTPAPQEKKVLGGPEITMAPSPSPRPRRLAHRHAVTLTAVRGDACGASCGGLHVRVTGSWWCGRRAVIRRDFRHRKQLRLVGVLAHQRQAGGLYEHRFLVPSSRRGLANQRWPPYKTLSGTSDDIGIYPTAPDLTPTMPLTRKQRTTIERVF